MTTDDQMIEAMAEAAWNLKALVPWVKIPEAWKPFYREQAWAALAAIRGQFRIVGDE